MSLLTFQCRHRYPSGFELDFAFEMAGGVTALLGPSGSGKSTILALIAGLLRPQFGRIQLAQRTLLDTAAGIWVGPEQRGVGLVPQEHLLFPHLTVRGNLLYGRKRRPRRSFALNDVVGVLELGDLLDRHPHTLSGGQRQRVAVGRAILRGPDLLLLDEPLSAIEAPLRDRILRYLEAAIERFQIPSLYVTHDQPTAARLAGVMIQLSDGNGHAAATLSPGNV